MAGLSKVFLGTWLGRATVNQAPDSRICDMGIEVKRQDKDKDAPPFDVFVNLNCLFQNGRVYRREETSLVLSGEGHDGVVPFISFDKVMNSVGVEEGPFHCAMREMRLSNFGDLGRVSGAWREDGTASCHGGQVVMQRKRWF
jgi:hypothetical protein